MRKNILILFILIMISPQIKAAHFIVGIVNNAIDGTSANGRIVIIWNPEIGISDNQTDIIGPSGNSGVNNIYMIDCEMLKNGCSIGNEIRIRVLDMGDNYISKEEKVIVTGAGFDIAPNLTLNSPPKIKSIFVDDVIDFPLNEVDLTPATTTNVFCYGTINDYDGEEDIKELKVEFFHNSKSFYQDTDNRSKHYSNSSCYLNLSYGNNREVSFNCIFKVEYYANYGDWNCTANVLDNLSISHINSSRTKINKLIALSVQSTLDFGALPSPGVVTEEKTILVSNAGNTNINLSLSGYSNEIGDGYSMQCNKGESNISIYYQKYNLTSTNIGELSLADFERLYVNLTTEPKIREFNLNFRENELINDAIKPTYWRIYVPEGVSGSCFGNIIFGAVESPED